MSSDIAAARDGLSLRLPLAAHACVEEVLDQRRARPRVRSRSGGTSIGTTFEPVVEVLAEAALPRSRACRSLLVAATTRTSTLMVSLPPTRSISLSCSTRSTLACAPGVHVADLVEEQRAAVRLLELAAPLLRGAGERALLVAEQLALDQLARGSPRS